MSSNAVKRTLSLCYISFKHGTPCRKRITCTITRATVGYQQIDNCNIANQIHGFTTIYYGKFILNTGIVIHLCVYLDYKCV